MSQRVVIPGFRKIESGGGGEGGTTNYNDLKNKPSINGVEIDGNKTLDDLGIQQKIDEIKSDLVHVEKQNENILDSDNLIKDVLYESVVESWGEDTGWYWIWDSSITKEINQSKDILYKGFPTLHVKLSNASGTSKWIGTRDVNFIGKTVYCEFAYYITNDIPEMIQLHIGSKAIHSKFNNFEIGWNYVSVTIKLPNTDTLDTIRITVGGNTEVYFSPILLREESSCTGLTVDDSIQNIKSVIKEIEITKIKQNNNKVIKADFNIPYNYSDEIPLYLYVETLFNKPTDIIYGIGGMNQIVQDASVGGFWLSNVSNTPKGTKVNIATGKKVLFIGDSYTAAGVYPKYVYDKITALGKTITLIGTQGTAPYKHEGHSGWRNYTYANCATGNDDIEGMSGTNPFYNPMTGKFDFAYYISNNNLETPDIVFINLGTNDFTQPVLRTEEETLTAMNTIVDSIKAFSSNIKVIHWCPALTPIGIKGFANHWEGIIRYTNLLIENFSGLCPIRYAMSPSEDGKFETTNINGHEYKVLKDWNHPADIGYEHIANMICGYIV